MPYGHGLSWCNLAPVRKTCGHEGGGVGLVARLPSKPNRQYVSRTDNFCEAANIMLECLAWRPDNRMAAATGGLL